jgi:hypothetical protein
MPAETLKLTRLLLAAGTDVRALARFWRSA